MPRCMISLRPQRQVLLSRCGRWVKSSQIPAETCTEGTVSLKEHTPETPELMRLVSAPSHLSAAALAQYRPTWEDRCDGMAADAVCAVVVLCSARPMCR